MAAYDVAPLNPLGAWRPVFVSDVSSAVAMAKLPWASVLSPGFTGVCNTLIDGKYMDVKTLVRPGS